MATQQEAISFYSLTSRDVNMFSEFPKKFKAFVKTKEGIKFLPSQLSVYPLPDQGRQPCDTGLNVHYRGTLTEEQEYIIDTITTRYTKYKYDCGLINMKTGKGKSHIIMKLVASLQKPTLIMCHNVKTLVEMVAKFKEFTDIIPGVWYGGHKKLGNITITTHDSFVLNGGVFDTYFPVILYDECDYNLSQKMFDALCNSNATSLYGLTGTPYTKHFSNSDMQKIFGKEIKFTDTENPTGYNMIPTIETYRYVSDNFKNYEYANWAEEKQCLVDDKTRLQAQIDLVKLKLAEGRQTILILTERVEEAVNYYDALVNYDNRNGTRGCFYDGEPLTTILITGETKIKDDNKSLEVVGTKPTIIVGTVGKMARGVDIPAIDTIMLFSALHFRGTVVQAVGRCLRNHSSKLHPLLVDWQDYPILKNQWYERKKAYQKEYGIHGDDIHTITMVTEKAYLKLN